jgi:hypothetical protein
MKWILPILFLLAITSSFGQKKDSVTCLPNKDIIRVANGIQLLRDTVSIQRTEIANLNLLLGWSESIRLQQDKLVGSYETRVINFQEQLTAKNGEVDDLTRANKELRDAIDDLKPKWYDNKWLWFGGGATAVAVFVGLVR